MADWKNYAEEKIIEIKERGIYRWWWAGQGCMLMLWYMIISLVKKKVDPG